MATNRSQAMIDDRLDEFSLWKIAVALDIRDLLAQHLCEDTGADLSKLKDSLDRISRGPLPQILEAMTISSDLPDSGRELCKKMLWILNELGLTKITPQDDM